MNKWDVEGPLFGRRKRCSGLVICERNGHLYDPAARNKGRQFLFAPRQGSHGQKPRRGNIRIVVRNTAFAGIVAHVNTMMNAIFIDVTQRGAAGFFIAPFGHRLGFSVNKKKDERHRKRACMHGDDQTEQHRYEGGRRPKTPTPQLR